jgi:transposase
MDTVASPRQVGPAEAILGFAFETGVDQWKIALSSGLGQPPRHRVVPARDLGRLRQEIERAKVRFGLPADARVVSCYEAGRDGFWLHRALVAMGVENVVVDSSSIEVNRRQRRAKTDRLDARRLVGMLFRWLWGDSVGTPSDSGETKRELGISKAGNRWVRGLAVEIAWGWRRYQPESELALWYERRFGHGSSRMRKVGIVALARKLLVALWRYSETVVVPAGAVLKS